MESVKITEDQLGVNTKLKRKPPKKIRWMDDPNFYLDTKSDEVAKVKEDDSFDFFGKYVASLLRQFPQEAADDLQKQIVCLVINSKFNQIGTKNFSLLNHNNKKMKN